MKIQTFSIVAGSEACNARCPFCISKMTIPNGVELKEPEVDWRNFRKACRLAELSGVTTAMITGKGEPTLFPKQISLYLQHLADYEIPLVEIQTNGLILAQQWEKYEPYLKTWYGWGLTTIAISVVHYKPERNHEIYNPYQKEYIDLGDLIKKLHDMKFSVRIACVLLDGYIDSPQEVANLIAVAQVHGVEQLKLCPVTKPSAEHNRDIEAYSWTDRHYIKPEQLQAIENYLRTNGTKIMELMHGAVVYDVKDQNVCLSNCLTIEPETGNIRQMIFFPDGHIRYDWQYGGAVLL